MPNKMKYRTPLLLLACLLQFNSAIAQTAFPAKAPVFDDTQVARIDIIIHPDSLTQLYADTDEEHDYPATFLFKNKYLTDTLEKIGFRLRGNTSRASKKKSYKLAFDAFKGGRKFYGIEQLNINGEHNDPSIVRAKLCFDILRSMQAPAQRAMHIALYINQVYYGLYIAVESVDEEFADIRYGNKNGNLYKCLWPANLEYLGNNPELYKFTGNGRRAYELKTNNKADDYADLAHFIDVLNNTPEANLPVELEKVFHVNTFLKILAVEIICGHWDNYAYNKNNFYLYHNTTTGKFEYIPYDMDNTFGIHWMNIDWANRNIYNWYATNDPRPLVTKILKNQTYKDRLSFYINKLVNEITTTEVFFPYIDSCYNLIKPYAYDDTYRVLDYNWKNADFDLSYTQALSGHVTYGLKPFITARNTSALQQVQLNDIAPIISLITTNQPKTNQPIIVTALIEDEASAIAAKLYYKLNNSEWSYIVMNDNGLDGDATANDGFYAATLAPISENGILYFYVSASDAGSKGNREPLTDNYTIALNNQLDLPLYINEFMASNQTTLSDSEGGFSDWIEIFNAGIAPIYLGDKYLTDDFDQPTKWKMPNINIAAGQFLLFWADGDTLDGAMHTNFKLDKSKEEIGIFNSISLAYSEIDKISYNDQQTDVSMGRLPDGYGNFQFMKQPTPGKSNVATGIEYMLADKMFDVYPNPFSETLNFRWKDQRATTISIFIYDLTGKLVYATTQPVFEGSIVSWTASGTLPNGVYVARIVDDSNSSVTLNKKIVLVR